MFICDFCAMDFPDFYIYIKHQKFHSILSEDKFLFCGYNGCKKYFSNERLLKIHLSYSHYLPVSIEENVVDNRQSELSDTCNIAICRQHFQDKLQIVKHMINHLSDGYEITCPFKDCDKKFTKPSSFNNHRYKKHPSQAFEKKNDVNNEIFDFEADFIKTEDFECYEKNFQQNLAYFYLKLESKYNIPVSTIDRIAVDIEQLRLEEREISFAKIRSTLLNENIPLSTITEVLKIINRSEMFVKYNAKFKTDDFRKGQYFSQKLYVKPQKKIIDEETYFHYVPIPRTLEAIFSSKHTKDNFTNLSLKNLDRNDENYTDYHSGQSFKSNEFFKKNPESLHIMLFQDAFEVVNPLGSARTKYKLLAIYIAIGNLPPHLRTHIDNIQLVGLVREKWFDHDKVFGPIVEDLKKLEEHGVEIEPGKKIKGGLVCICGDNLGSHGIGGFQESFSKKVEYFCRYCEVKNSEFPSKDEKDEFPKYNVLRTPKSYDSAIKNLENSKKKVTNVKGIKRNSIFNSLQSFHVCKPGLPPCCGHDVMEGVLAYDIMLIIKELVEKKFFNYNKLNQAIENFPFILEDGRNRPKPKISSSNDHVVGSAWEIRTLIRFLPLIIFKINPKIKEFEDKIWRSLLLLVEITDILCAPEINNSYLGYLQSLTDEYLSLRKSTFTEPLRPKHHYLSHYAYLIQQFGPLIRVWAMRFESKHTFFKNAVRRLRNLKDLSGTMSVRHELYQYLLRNGHNLNVTINPKYPKKLVTGIYSDDIKNLIVSNNLHEKTVECNSVTVNGVDYNVGNILILGSKFYQEELEAGKIFMIIVRNDNEIFFILQKVQTNFVYYLQSYEIIYNKNMEFTCTNIQKIKHNPLHLYNINGLELIKLKHEIVSDVFN